MPLSFQPDPHFAPSLSNPPPPLQEQPNTALPETTEQANRTTIDRAEHAMKRAVQLDPTSFSSNRRARRDKGCVPFNPDADDADDADDANDSDDSDDSLESDGSDSSYDIERMAQEGRFEADETTANEKATAGIAAAIRQAQMLDNQEEQEMQHDFHGTN